jgi:hypothetical protein
VSNDFVFRLSGPGLPSGIASGIEVRATPGGAGTAIDLRVFSPSSAPLDAHMVASAIGGAIARLDWNTDRLPAPEGSEHEEERLVQVQLIGDLERVLREAGLR